MNKQQIIKIVISVLIAALTAVAAAVKARANNLSNIATDEAAFKAQKDTVGGKKTMKAYL